ncbi:hypothetical protein ACWGSK_14605 [Nocardiopsis sp. NPDC055551]|uniref:hypothetical protein n=1 Tax=Nocardiopsis sp. NPDC006832 TaxID=3157188 RepID=UPI00340126B3
MYPHRLSASRRASWFLSVPLLAILVLSGASSAQADSERSVEDRVGPAEYYAGLLTEEPEGEAVIVDDSIAGLYDLDELETDLHEAFAPLDVPYYVVAGALPGHSTMPLDFLAAVQDRVGRPGLYVYLRPGSAEVTAVSREVGLPVERANRVLLNEENLVTYLPIDTSAELFARTLVAPDLDERFEEGWGSPWQRLGPLYWWAESHLRPLRMETYDSPERLGEATALTVGVTITLALAFGVMRSGRRRRAAEAGHTGRLRGDRALMVGMVVATATGVVVVAASLVQLDRGTLPEDVEKVAPVPPETAPYVVDTVRLERVAEALREDPIYVDPQAQVDTEGLDRIVERGLPENVPVHVAVMPMNPHDESGGDGEVFVHALHHVMDEDGFYVVVSGEAGVSTRVETARFGVDYSDGERDWTHLEGVTGYLDGSTPAQALDGLLGVVEEEVERAPGQASEVPYTVESRADPRPEPSRISRFFSGDFLTSLFLIGPIVAGVLLTLAWCANRLVNRARAVPGRALRPRADRAVRRMAKALQTAPAAHPGRDKALRESDMALTVLGAHPDELDLVGVTVLADRAVLRLDPDPETAARAEEPVCAVNPLHGTSIRQGAVRGKGRKRNVVLPQPLCRSCSTLTESQRRARTLLVAGPGGGRVPYLELDREWNRGGYGTKYRLNVEDLLKESDVH